MIYKATHPLQKWICAACVLSLWCSECCTCASCTYVQNMCRLLPYLIYACYRYDAQVSLACMNITTVLRTCCLHTCKLLVLLICAACIHAYYYSAAYTLLTYMRATSVPHMCSMHTCMLLQCCIHAAYTHASY